MPALYDYFGMIFLFYSNEHEPVKNAHNYSKIVWNILE